MIKQSLFSAKSLILKGVRSLASRAFNTLLKMEAIADFCLAILWKKLKILGVVLPVTFLVLTIYDKTHPEEPKSNLNKKLLDVKYSGPSHPYDETLNRALIRIVAKNKKGEDTAICSAFVISDSYALTAGHCVVDDNYELLDDTYTIYNDEGKEITKAKAAGFISRPDLGILRGNFSKFNQVPLRYKDTFVSATSGQFVSCGFPQGSKKPFCEKFNFQYVSGFSFRGSSILIPGMSGGITIDTATGEAIGANSASYDSGANAAISPLIGFDAAFGIEE